MSPSLYLYKESNEAFELYFGECSTLEGLSVFDAMTEISITNFGASSYKNYGWATEKELPNLHNIGAVIDFLKKEDEIDIIDFEVKISGYGTLSTHDNGEISKYYSFDEYLEKINN